MRQFKKHFGSILTLILLSSISMYSQCENWEGKAMQGEAEDAHSIYRQALKANDLEIAFENWEKAYSIAPAADGKRDYHFIDGAKLYGEKFKTASAEEKPAISEKIVSLYEQAVACYESKSIKPSKCADGSCYPKRIGGVYAKLGFDMFYTLNSPYSKNLEVYKKALDIGGNDLDYTVFDPVLSMVAYQFEKGKMDKETALDFYGKIEKIADHNIANHPTLAEYFDQAWKSAKSKLTPVEADLFDCDYFKPAYEKMYDEDPDNPDNLKQVIGLLKKRGCDPSDPLLARLEAKWKTYASVVNAERQAEFEQNNPGVMANKMYKEGNFQGAIDKYREALAMETDPMKKAGYHTSIASILFRKMKQYGEARKEARTALSLRPGWGKPMNLIGDMYATSARNCGDSWNQRLAIIAAMDKYRAAKADPDFAEEAQRKLSKYSNSLPEKQEGFMRGVQAGSKATVGCWIGETVTVRYK